ncbi:MAG: AAA family ATPase [Actinomycetales bacterium]|nr:AAA family ATPase [Actinomycetales bacterium]
MPSTGPHLLPEEPYFAHESEREVWNLLRAQLPPQAYLLASLKVEDPSRGPMEADLVVIWPGEGVAVIEVKGGNVTLTSSGQWQQNDRNERRYIDPFGQAKRAQYALHRWIQDKVELPAMRTAVLVVLPHSFAPVGYERIDEPRLNIIDRSDLPSAADKIKAALGARITGAQPPSEANAERLAESLRQGLLDPNDLAQMGHLVGDRHAQVEALVRNQEQLLENLRLLNRFEVRGAAGTGKTALALAQARRLSAQGKRVLFLCYTRLLARDLRKRTEKWPREERPAVVKTFHNLADEWHRQTPEKPDQAFWEYQSAALLKEAALAARAEDRFDAVVIDEAQDFGNEWWWAVKALLREPESGGIYAFGDDDQRIFNREGAQALGLVPICLTTNLRNTKPIASAAASMIANPPRLLDFDGAPVIFVDCPREEAVDRADGMTEVLFDDWEPRNIVLLTTGTRHPVEVEHLEADATGDLHERALWDEDTVYYATAMKFKGLERPAVVIAVNGFLPHARPAEVLYVALTRARDLCVICGDAAEIEAIVGPEVMATWQRRTVTE